MAKTTQALLIWSQEQQVYRWHDPEDADTLLLQTESEAWLREIAGHTSFSFHGKEGQFTLLREKRPRGEDGYWYAYRRRGKRTLKKYAGRTADLTFARLEHTARELLKPAEQISPTINNALKTEQPVPAQQQREPSYQEPLLASKLCPPRLHSSLIVRERLLTRLDHGLEYRLTLLCAPAGSGKTTLARQWITHSQLPPVAWISLDGGDNDPVRFWRYLMTACQVFRTDLAQSALTQLQATWQPPFEQAQTKIALTTFLNALAAYQRQGIIVLDDYHLITNPWLHETLTFFLDYLPANIHILLITRHDPPFSLARLWARNELYELRSNALRFSQEETTAFLQQTHTIPLIPETLRYIHTHLQGWATGLRLLQNTLHERTTPTEVESLFKAFAGDQHALQAYFLTEVFLTQPEPTQLFLLQTSVLGRLTGPLCDAVTGEKNSEQILATLEQTNFFLEPLDSSGRWYRYHGLFAEAMQQEAQRRLGNEALRTISSYASQWYEDQAFPAEAIEAALHAQDYTRAAVLIERFLETPDCGSQIHEYYTLHNWLEQIPETLLQQRPILCLGYATALLFVIVSWQLTPMTLTVLEKLLSLAEQGFSTAHNLPQLGKVFAFRALLAWRQEETLQAASYARQALISLSEKQYAWRCLSLSITGKAILLYYGQVKQAYAILEDASRLCEVTNNPYFRRTINNMLARVYYEQGKLHRAADHYQRALNEARERGYSVDISHALYGLAQISYEWNELEMARQQAQEALAIGQSLAHELHEVHTTLLLARIQHARGETDAARQRLHVLLNRLRMTLPDQSSPLLSEVQIMLARLALAANDQAAVQRWIMDLKQTHRTTLPSVCEQETLVIARWHLGQHQEEEALNILDKLLQEAQETGRQQSVFTAQLLQALIYAALAEGQKARHLLQIVFSQTHVENFVRLFVDEGEAMATLVRSLVFHLRTHPLLPHLQDLLHAFPIEQRAVTTPSSIPLFEPLSPQEFRVLRQLVQGHTNADIAREMVVSINTIRTQVQSIYRKLHVHNRRAASEAGRLLIAESQTE